MGKNNIRFTASAYEDLDRITDYLIERDSEAAIRIYERIMEAVKRLREFPLMGVTMDDQELRAYGYRKLIVDDFSVIYRLFEGEIVLYHVFNHKQDYGRIFAK